MKIYVLQWDDNPIMSSSYDEDEMTLFQDKSDAMIYPFSESVAVLSPDFGNLVPKTVLELKEKLEHILAL